MRKSLLRLSLALAVFAGYAHAAEFADPTLLPKAVGQGPVGPNPNIAGNTFYNDPTSGVRVWRATSVSYPCANNTGGSMHDYGDVLQISGDLGGNKHTLYFHTCGEYKLVDFV